MNCLLDELNYYFEWIYCPGEWIDKETTKISVVQNFTELTFFERPDVYEELICPSNLAVKVIMDRKMTFIIEDGWRLILINDYSGTLDCGCTFIVCGTKTGMHTVESKTRRMFFFISLTNGYRKKLSSFDCVSKHSLILKILK